METLDTISEDKIREILTKVFMKICAKELSQLAKPNKSRVLADLKEFFNETGLIFNTDNDQLEDLADTICKESK